MLLNRNPRKQQNLNGQFTDVFTKSEYSQVPLLDSVTCMLFIFLFIIDIVFTYFLSDLDIDSKQVVYICFKILLERMTNQ